jgi:hypothetical protein
MTQNKIPLSGSLSGGSASAEDRIIQYMDGELTDSESAELLHSASVSPEIRQMLAEHEQLAQMSQRALIGTSIPPALEERVLAHVGELAAASNRTAGAAFWSQSWVRFSSVLLLIGGATLTAFLMNSSTSSTSSPRIDQQSFGTRPSNPERTIPATSLGQMLSAPSDAHPIANDLKVTSRVFANLQHAPIAVSNRAIAQSTTAKTTSDIERNRSSNHLNDLSPDRQVANLGNKPEANLHNVDKRDLATIPKQTNNVNAVSNEAAIASFAVVAPRSKNPFAGSPKRESTNDLAHIHPIEIDRLARISNFELGLQTSSGFSYPASGPNVHPFADFRANLGYFLSDQDVIGFRLTSGLFQALPGIVRTTTNSATIVHRDVSEQRELAEEIFYGHRFLLSSQSGLALETAIGGGLIPQGNTISLELGFKLPFGDHFMGTAGFSLMRIHSTAPSLDQVITNELSTAGNMPVVFEGSDIRNTLNGRIQYGFAYRF